MEIILCGNTQAGPSSKLGVIILRQERQVKSAKRTPISCGNTQAGPSSKFGGIILLQERRVNRSTHIWR